MSGKFKALFAEGLKLMVNDDGMATVFMVNGENRFRLSFIKAWMKVLDEIEKNDKIKGLVITGMDKYFSLGLDLDFLLSQPADYMEKMGEANGQLYRRIMLLPIPTVAAINGHAYGAGGFLALSCDYRIMRQDRGWICFPETALNMQMKEWNLKILRLKLGVGNPLRQVIFSRRLSATDAKSIQLVDQVCEKADDLLPFAVQIIEDCLGKNGLDKTSLLKMKKDIYGYTSWQKENLIEAKL